MTEDYLGWAQVAAGPTDNLQQVKCKKGPSVLGPNFASLILGPNLASLNKKSINKSSNCIHTTGIKVQIKLMNVNAFIISRCLKLT